MQSPLSANLTKNHFELFDIPITFDIDNEQLTARYRTLQRMFHPDRFAHTTPQEQRLSMQYSAQLNDAYQVLKKPLNRAEYLLTLYDVSNEGHTVTDGEFLMEQFELREQLMAIRKHDDGADQLVPFSTQIQQRLTTLMQQFSEQMRAKNLERAQLTLNRMQFVTRLLDEIEALEEELC
ncbi:MAG: Fe-S protein assembly co-chaperone HscB [Gammaproteobacteria bacterium]|nr:Fe-S protein assembly co-chaperone HscB [Gammaproteobacteria bacterium]